MRKIKGIYVEIRGDYSQLQKDLTEARAVIKAQAKGMSDALNNALTPTQVSAGINAMVRDLSKLSRTSVLQAKDFQNLNVELGDLGARLGITSDQFKGLQTRMLQTRAATGAQSALRNLAVTADLTKAEIRDLGKQFNLTDKQIKAVQTSVTKTGSAMSTVFKVGGIIYMAQATVRTVVNMERALYDATLQAQRLNISFQNITGSSAGARGEMEFLRKTADATGQNFWEIAGGYKGILAAANNANIGMEVTQKLFRGITKAGADYALSTEQLNGTLYAFEQMISKGKISAEEVRRQWGDRMPGAFQLAAEAMGVTTMELDKMLDRGLLLTSDFIPRIADLLDTKFKGNVPPAVAALNKFNESWTTLKTNIANSDTMMTVLDELSGRMRWISQAIDPSLDQKIDKLTKEGLELFKTFEYHQSTGNKAAADAIREQIEDLGLRISELRAVQNAMDVPADSWMARDQRRLSEGQKEVFGVLSSQLKAEEDMRAKLDKIRLDSADLAIKKIHEEADEFRRAKLSEAKIAAYVNEATSKVYTEAADKSLRSLNDQIAKLTLSAADYERFSLARQFEDLEKQLGRSNPALADAKRLAEEMSRLNIAQIISPDQQRYLDRANKNRAGFDLLKNVDQGEVTAAINAAAVQAHAQDLKLMTEFAEKHREVVLGETKFKLEQIEEQARAYRQAGADEVAVAQWAAQEKLGISRKWRDGAKRALNEYADDATNAAKNSATFFTNAMGSMEDALVAFSDTSSETFGDIGKSFEGMINGMIQDMERMVIRQTITGPLAQGISGGLSTFFAGIFHQGGTVGKSAPMRPVDPAIFAGAPRYHGGGTVGLGPDEYPIIAKRGEQVIPKGAGGQAGAAMLNVKVINNAGAQVRTSAYEDSQGNTNLEIIVDRQMAKLVNTPGSATRRALMSSGQQTITRR